LRISPLFLAQAAKPPERHQIIERRK
jgi:hypothetical protein